jgi:hypothetical protein
MNIEVINENKNYWYSNRKGIVCKVVEEKDDNYTVKVWLHKHYMRLAVISKDDCVISEKKAWNKNKTIESFGEFK